MTGTATFSEVSRHFRLSIKVSRNGIHRDKRDGHIVTSSVARAG